jgi:hypothetical protein
VRDLLQINGVFSSASAVGAPGHAATYGVALSQESSLPPFQIAAPFPNETAFEMVGRSEHLESAFTSYGYLFSIAGMDQSMIFSEPGSTGAASARFTYFARLNGPEESPSGSVPVMNADGTLTIYFSENGGSNLDSAETFYRGSPIATFEVRLQEVLQVGQQESGVIVGDGTLRQVIETPFSLDGDQYRFGHAGLEERFLYTGTTMEQVPNPVSFTASVAGHVTVTGTQATGEAVTGTPASEASPESTETVDASCEGAEPWLEDSMANATEAEAIIAGIPASPSVQSLDPVAVSDAATKLANLVGTQREAAVPEVGISANRLLVTALGTYSRGAMLIEQAVADGDEATLSQALDILQDGKELTARALEQLAQIATTCGIQT